MGRQNTGKGKTAVREEIFTFFVVLSSGLRRKLHLQNPFCIEALYGFIFSTVHGLSSREGSWQSKDSKPGPLGEKRGRYLCAMRLQPRSPTKKNY